MRKIGKTVGSCTYTHRLYETEIVPHNLLSRTKAVAGDRIIGYTCVRYDKRNQTVAFQFSPDFDTEDEPTVGDTVLVKLDGTITVTRQKRDPQIWHHKWMWVKDDYQGFDVEASKARSKLWETHVDKNEKCKIGTRSFWDSIRGRWEPDMSQESRKTRKKKPFNLKRF